MNTTNRPTARRTTEHPNRHTPNTRSRPMAKWTTVRPPRIRQAAQQPDGRRTRAPYTRTSELSDHHSKLNWPPPGPSTTTSHPESTTRRRQLIGGHNEQHHLTTAGFRLPRNLPNPPRAAAAHRCCQPPPFDRHVTPWIFVLCSRRARRMPMVSLPHHQSR